MYKRRNVETLMQACINQLSILLLCPGCLNQLTEPKQFENCKHLICKNCSGTFTKCPLELDDTGHFYTKFNTLNTFKVNETLKNSALIKPLKEKKPWFFVDGIVSRLPDLLSQLSTLFMSCQYKQACLLVDEITDEFVCPICSGPLGNINSVSVQPCTHMLCKTCLENWTVAQRKTTCPVCNTPIQKKRVSYFSNETIEVIDSNPLGSFERFLLQQIPKLLLQLLTLAIPEDFQQDETFKMVQKTLYDFIKANESLTNDYTIDPKRNSVIVEGLETSLISKDVVPAEIAEIGDVKFVKNLTYSKASGRLISIVIFKRTEAAQRSIALDELYVQGYQVRVRPAPTESALFESQLLNSFSLIQVIYDKFNVKFLPFLKMKCNMSEIWPSQTSAQALGQGAQQALGQGAQQARTRCPHLQLFGRK